MESISMSEKDKVIFCTKESHKEPSKYDLPPALEEGPRGISLPDGSINWTCPCLGGLPYGPCGYEFRQFFACLKTLDEDADKSECTEKFIQMKSCFNEFPKLYQNDDDEEEIGDKDSI